MTKSDRTDHGKPRKREWSEKQIERLVAVIGVLALAAIIGLYLMIRAWGVWGLVWRFLGLVLTVLAGWLAWKYRRQLWAGFKAGAGRLAVWAWDAITRKHSAKFRRLVAECTDAQGRTLIPLSRLADLVGMGDRQRFNPAQSGWICQAAQRAGYCIEPDARLSGRNYRADDIVTAYPLAGADASSAQQYQAAGCFLRMGLTIAAADGLASPDELDFLLTRVGDLFQLAPPERRRLSALLTLLRATENRLADLGPVIGAMTADQKLALAKMLLALAAVDGVVTRDEIRALRKVHKALGFDKEQIDQALASLRKVGQEPVTIRPPGPGEAGEAIPAPPVEAAGEAGAEEPAEAEEKGFRLDHAAIATIMDDTREVARMLAEAMKTQADGAAAGGEWRTAWAGPAVLEAPPAGLGAGEAAVAAAPPADQGQAPDVPAAPSPADSAGPVDATGPVDAVGPALPERYAAFYRVLISRKEWPVKEIASLARQDGLMFSGAIDELNEWAAQKFGGQLFIEDGPTLFVEHEYLN